MDYSTLGQMAWQKQQPDFAHYSLHQLDGQANCGLGASQASMMMGRSQQDSHPSQLLPFQQSSWQQDQQVQYLQHQPLHQQQAVYAHQCESQTGVEGWAGARQTQGYAYHEPAWQAEVEAATGLRAVKELPLLLQGLFPFKYFNAVQSDCFESVYHSDSNIVVAAPTGSGKTGVMELAVVRLLSQHLSSAQATSLDARTAAAGKVAYFAPTRALVQEKAKDWADRYGKLGFHVVELTGDADPDRSQLEGADIICSTPEKFDSVTRRLQEGGAASFFGETSLVLIDEVHLLGEPGRGAALEAGVVSRIKMVSQWPSMKQMPISRVRFVAVSATIPNVDDIAAWLNVQLPGGLHVYGEEMRPCKLRTIVKSFQPSKNDFLFERKLNDHVAPLIAEYSQHKPTLVFCSSRKGTTEAAAHLAKQLGAPGRAGPYIRDQGHAARLHAAASRTSQKQLKAVLEAGVGFHHAAMDAQDRALVESLFLAQDLPVLCTTSTLALGVNLPAHLVIIKGTRRYCGAGDAGADANGSSGYKEYDKAVCLQMVGRAGRPQFDKEGVAVIMTQRDMAARYQGLVDGAEEVESSLKECFAEHLNAEVVLKTIQDITQAIQWLKSTFLFVRMQRKPVQYGVPRDMLAHAAASGGNVGLAVESYLRDHLVMHNVKLLVQHGLMHTDEDGFSLTSCEPGRIMAHHYIALDTMVKVVSAPPSLGVPQLLGLMARAAELQHIHIRRGEKRLLQEIHAAPLDKGGPRYPLPDGHSGKRKDKIVTPEEKVYVLLNEALADVPSDKLDYSLKQEQEQMVRVADRVAGAMAKFYMLRGSFAAACNALQLVKSLRFRMWPDSAQQCRQLSNVGRLTASRLAGAGMGDLRVLAAADARSIEAAAQRFFPFGDQLKRELASSLPPPLAFTLLQVRPSADRSRLEVQLQLTRLQQDSAVDGQQQQQQQQSGGSHARVLVGSVADDRLLYQQSIVAESFACPQQINVTVSACKDTAGASKQRLVACVLMNRSLGLDTIATFDVSVEGMQAGRHQHTMNDLEVGNGGQLQAFGHEGCQQSEEGDMMEIEMPDDVQGDIGPRSCGGVARGGTTKRVQASSQRPSKSSNKQQGAGKATKKDGDAKASNAAGAMERVICTRLPPRPTLRQAPAGSATSFFQLRSAAAHGNALTLLRSTAKVEGVTVIGSGTSEQEGTASPTPVASLPHKPPADLLPGPHKPTQEMPSRSSHSKGAHAADLQHVPATAATAAALDGHKPMPANGTANWQQSKPLLGGSTLGMYSRWASISAKWASATACHHNGPVIDTFDGAAADLAAPGAVDPMLDAGGAQLVTNASRAGTTASSDQLSCNDDGSDEPSRPRPTTANEACPSEDQPEQQHDACGHMRSTAVTAATLSASPCAAETAAATAHRDGLHRGERAQLSAELLASNNEGWGSTSDYDDSSAHDGRELLSSGSKAIACPTGSTVPPDVGSTPDLNLAMHSAKGLLSLMPNFAQPAPATCQKSGHQGLSAGLRTLRRASNLGAETPPHVYHNTSSVSHAAFRGKASASSIGTGTGKSSSKSSGGNGEAGNDRHGAPSGGATCTFGAVSGGSRAATPAKRASSPGLSFQLHAAGMGKSPPATPVIWRSAAAPVTNGEAAGAGAAAVANNTAAAAGAVYHTCVAVQHKQQHAQVPAAVQASPVSARRKERQDGLCASRRHLADISNTFTAAVRGQDSVKPAPATTIAVQSYAPPAVRQALMPASSPHASTVQPDAIPAGVADVREPASFSSSKAMMQQKLLGGGKQGLKRLQELTALQTKRARHSDADFQAVAPMLMHQHGMDDSGRDKTAPQLLDSTSMCACQAETMPSTVQHDVRPFSSLLRHEQQQLMENGQQRTAPAANTASGIQQSTAPLTSLSLGPVCGIVDQHASLGQQHSGNGKTKLGQHAPCGSFATARPLQAAVSDAITPKVNAANGAPSSSVIDPFMDLLCLGW